MRRNLVTHCLCLTATSLVLTGASAAEATNADVGFGAAIIPTITSAPSDITFAPTNLNVALPADTNVLQCRTLTLSANFDGVPSPTFQWYREDFPIDSSANPAATNATLVITNVQPSDGGSYYCEVANSLGSARSRTAVVTVVPDTEGPVPLLAVGSPDLITITVSFSEPVSPDCFDFFAYSVFPRDGDPFGEDSLRVLSANLAPDGSNIVFTTDWPRDPTISYVMAFDVSGFAGVCDVCAGNFLTPDTIVQIETALCLLARDDKIEWRYNNSGTDLGTAWRHPAYDDSRWPKGLQMFGVDVGIGGLRTPLVPPSEGGPVTHYFRVHFHLLAKPEDVTDLFLNQILDDGAVYYLNGNEVLRSHIPTTEVVNFHTLATNNETYPEGPFRLPTSSLREGDNVLAVELHDAFASGDPRGTFNHLGIDVKATAQGLYLSRHPADLTPPDNMFTVEEVLAYANAWKRAQDWAVGPNPIPVSYALRAGGLWKQGGCYRLDVSQQTTAPGWWVTATNCVQSGPLLASHSPRQVHNESEFESAAASIAMRVLPDSYRPGAAFRVVIEVIPAPGVLVYAVEEYPPLNWPVQNISHSGNFAAKSVRWLFFDGNRRTLTYDVIPPLDAFGQGSFRGEAVLGGSGIVATNIVGDDKTIYPLCVLRMPYPQASGAFQFTVSGEAGLTYLIQASSNLMNWTTLDRYTNASELFQFIDTASTNFSQRFYRVQIEP